MSGFSIDFFPSKLGGGIPGGQPKGGLLGGGGGSSGGSGMQGGGPRGIDRTVLRQAFGLVTVPGRAGTTDAGTEDQVCDCEVAVGVTLANEVPVPEDLDL